MLKSKLPAFLINLLAREERKINERSPTAEVKYGVDQSSEIVT